MRTHRFFLPAWIAVLMLVGAARTFAEGPVYPVPTEPELSGTIEVPAEIKIPATREEFALLVNTYADSLIAFENEDELELRVFRNGQWIRLAYVTMAGGIFNIFVTASPKLLRHAKRFGDCGWHYNLHGRARAFCDRVGGNRRYKCYAEDDMTGAEILRGAKTAAEVRASLSHLRGKMLNMREELDNLILECLRDKPSRTN
ncbi:MAG: hypothetical protein H6506_03795 [Calditrichaeota bacterium]|nr:hypothetical protein [Calditrichota bacterium]MCB9391756.1 hypothetical protein [Calditrichota bacterium]